MLWIWSYPLNIKEFFIKLVVPKKLAKSLKTICKELHFYCICRLWGAGFIKKNSFTIVSQGCCKTCVPLILHRNFFIKDFFNKRTCGFGHIYIYIYLRKTIFFVQCYECIRCHINSLYKLTCPNSKNVTSFLFENQYVIIYQVVVSSFFLS